MPPRDGSGRAHAARGELVANDLRSWPNVNAAVRTRPLRRIAGQCVTFCGGYRR